ncbi:hypothetical protein CPC08DRAFT_716038 [Agrocybe pediades]|nr:hypothetical protein CPC08DRAFT_716038 [Agrocybe pediades]
MTPSTSHHTPANTEFAVKHRSTLDSSILDVTERYIDAHASAKQLRRTCRSGRMHSPAQRLSNMLNVVP